MNGIYHVALYKIILFRRIYSVNPIYILNYLNFRRLAILHNVIYNLYPNKDVSFKYFKYFFRTSNKILMIRIIRFK